MPDYLNINAISLKCHRIQQLLSFLRNFSLWKSDIQKWRNPLFCRTWYFRMCAIWYHNKPVSDIVMYTHPTHITRSHLISWKWSGLRRCYWLHFILRFKGILWDRRWIAPSIDIFPQTCWFFYRNAFLIMKLSNPPSFRAIRALIASQSTFEI